MPLFRYRNNGIHIIKGRVTLGANLIAAAIKNSRVFDYKVIKLDNSGCILHFFKNGEFLGESSFDEKDAIAAGLLAATDPWKKFRRNMFFSRAISNGAKWFTPEVFGGNPVYTPDELGATVNDEGDVITLPANEVNSPIAPINNNNRNANLNSNGGNDGGKDDSYSNVSAFPLNPSGDKHGTIAPSGHSNASINPTTDADKQKLADTISSLVRMHSRISELDGVLPGDGVFDGLDLAQAKAMAITYATSLRTTLISHFEDCSTKLEALSPLALDEFDNLDLQALPLQKLDQAYQNIFARMARLQMEDFTDNDNYDGGNDDGGNDQ